MIGRWASLLASCLVMHAAWVPSPRAQTAPAAESQTTNFDAQQLDALLAPVALYPDALLMQLLMASTFPLQVVEAVRWIDDAAHKNLKGDALTKALASVDWDPSVKSLVPFPQVLQQMNAKLDWLEQLGYAFIAQQQDVLDSVQRLRRQAQAAGKLQSSPQQVVATQQDSGETTVTIAPAQPDVVYVPTYDPAVVYGAWPYPAYPPVYLPPQPGYVVGTALVAGLAFAAGVAIAGGLWGWASPNWGRGNINVNVNRWNNINVNRQRINSNVWNASNRPGGLSPEQRRAPTSGPVGRPTRAGLPNNAIGRANVGVPGNLVNHPGRQGPEHLSQGGRSNLSPGSRPNAGPEVNRPTPAARPQTPPRPAQGDGAFGSMGEGRSAEQFGQRGGQSRQATGGGGFQRAGGGARAGGGGGRR